MKIKMLVPIKSDRFDLIAGDDGESLTDKEKAKFVKVGLAEEVAGDPYVGMLKADLIQAAEHVGIEVEPSDTKADLIEKLKAV